MSLDNRPKTVVVSFLDGEPYEAHEEALRQYLMFNSLETAQLSRHPERGEGALVTFTQRYEGENFMAALIELRRQIGGVELGWYAANGKGVGIVVNGEDARKESKAKSVVEPEAKEEMARDMDTYDDDMDRWG